MLKQALIVFAAVVAASALRAAEPPASPGRPKAQEAAAALARGDTAQAIAGFTAALEDASLPNDRRGVVLNDRGVAYARLGQTKLAVEDFNRAVQLFPEYAAVYNNRGNLLLTLAQYKEAIKDFDRALLLAPGYAAAYNNRAGAYLKLGQTADAIHDYTSAIKLLPANAAPLSGRGRAFLSIKRPHAAIRDFTRAVGSDARFASAYRNRAEAQIDVQQYPQAVEDFSRAIAFDLNNAEIYVLRGEAYLASGDSDAAIKDFSRAIELEPQAAGAYTARGLAHGLSGAFDEAFADLNRAIELDPRSAVAFACRAFVYKQNAQADIGQSDIQTALQIDENLPEVLWAKGELADAAGRKEQAIADLRRALALKPSLKLAASALERLGADPNGEEKEEPGLGLDKWRVVSRGETYFAVNDGYPRLRVPLETLGEGAPKILEWEEKKAPLKGIGVLRFYAGSVEGRAGREDIEQVAILDLWAKSVVAIQLHRQGAKLATWTWNEGKVVVASADGVTDEYALRAAAREREPGERSYTNAPDGWSPFADSWGPPSRYDSPRRSAPRRRPKSLFDLLFN